MGETNRTKGQISRQVIIDALATPKNIDQIFDCNPVRVRMSRASVQRWLTDMRREGAVHISEFTKQDGKTLVVWALGPTPKPAESDTEVWVPPKRTMPVAPVRVVARRDPLVAALFGDA